MEWPLLGTSGLPVVVDVAELARHLRSSLSPRRLAGTTRAYENAFTGDEVQQALLQLRGGASVGVLVPAPPSFLSEQDAAKIGTCAIGSGIIQRVRRGGEVAAKIQNVRAGSIVVAGRVVEMFKPGKSRFYRFGIEEEFRFALFVTVVSGSGLHSSRTKGVASPIVRIEFKSPSSGSVKTSAKTTSNGIVEWNETFLFFIDSHLIDGDIESEKPDLNPKKVISQPHLDFSVVDHYHMHDHEIAKHGRLMVSDMVPNLQEYSKSRDENEALITLKMPRDNLQVSLTTRILMSRLPAPPLDHFENSTGVGRSASTVSEDFGTGIVPDEMEKGDIPDDISIENQSQCSYHSAPETLDMFLEEEPTTSESRVRAGTDPGRINIGSLAVSSSDDVYSMVMTKSYLNLLKRTIQNMPAIETKVDECIAELGDQFALSHPRLAFDILRLSSLPSVGSIPITDSDSASSNNSIEAAEYGADKDVYFMASFELVGPLLPGLVHRLSANVVHYALSVISNGVRATSAVIKRERARVWFESFRDYTTGMQMVWERVALIEHNYAQKLYKFEQRGLKTARCPGERVLFHQDYVRGAVEGKTSIMTLGNLFITSHNLLYVREKLIGHRDAARLDMSCAFRATPNDARALPGLMILFHGDHEFTTGGAAERESNLVKGKTGKARGVSSCVFRFHSKTIRDLNLKIIQEVIAFQTFLREFLVPLLDSLGASPQIRERAADLASEALAYDVASIQAIRSAANNARTMREKATKLFRKNIGDDMLNLKPTGDSGPVRLPALSIASKADSGVNSKESMTDEGNEDDSDAEEHDSDHYRGIVLPDIFSKMLRVRQEGDMTSFTGLLESFSSDKDKEGGDQHTLAHHESDLMHQRPINRFSLSSLTFRSFAATCVLTSYREKQTKLPWEISAPTILRSPQQRFSCFVSLLKQPAPATKSTGIRDRFTALFDQDPLGGIGSGDDEDDDEPQQSALNSMTSLGLPKDEALLEGGPVFQELLLGDTYLHLSSRSRRWFIHYIHERLQTDIKMQTRLQTLAQNAALLKKILEPIQEGLHEMNQSYQDLVSWKTPIFSGLAMILSLLVIFAGLVGYLPSVFLLVLVYFLVGLQNKRLSNQIPDLELPEKSKQSLLEKYQNTKAKYIAAKNGLYQVNIIMLKIRGLVTSESPRITNMLITFIALVALALAVVPAKVLQTVFILHIFTSRMERRIRMRKRMIRLLRRFWNVIPSSRLLAPPSIKHTGKS